MLILYYTTACSPDNKKCLKSGQNIFLHLKDLRTSHITILNTLCCLGPLLAILVFDIGLIRSNREKIHEDSIFNAFWRILLREIFLTKFYEKEGYILHTYISFLYLILSHSIILIKVIE